MFSVPYSTYSTIHLDPLHPIPTAVQPFLNPKNNWTLANIKDGNCIFSARSNYARVAEFRFDFLNSLSFNFMDRGLNLKAIRDWIFHSSPSSSSSWIVNRGFKNLSFFSSTDTLCNVKYGLICNETWPKFPAFSS